MNMPKQSAVYINTHDLKQPLNVIRLVSDNVKARIIPQLGTVEAEYLAGKLSRIDSQVERIMAMMESSAPGHAADGEVQ